MYRRFLIFSILMVFSAVVTQAASAAGEPKNQSPFTQKVAAVPNDESDVVSRYLARQHSSVDAQGEAKNDMPFTRQSTTVPYDESDVVSRYLSRTQASGVQVEPREKDGGFDWTLAFGIAAAVGVSGAGLALGFRWMLQHRVPQAA